MDVEAIVSKLNELCEAGQLVVFDQQTKELLSDDAIEGVCLNGSAIQMTLAPYANRGEPRAVAPSDN